MRLFILSILITINVFAQVGVGTTTPNAILDIQSINSGVLIPRMTRWQRNNNLTTPDVGELIYQTNNTPGFYYYDGTNWSRISNSRSASASGGAFEFNANLTGIESTIATNQSPGRFSFSVGDNNTNNANYASCYGEGNNLSGGHYAFAGGLNNVVNNNGRFSAAFGESNNLNSIYSLTAGNSNQLSNSSYDYLFGLNNTTQGRFSTIFGEGNSISMASLYTSAFGNNNNINGNSSFTFVVGENNNISDSDVCFVFGRNNLMDNTTSRAFSIGQGNRVYGDYGGTLGLGLRKNAYCEVVVGHHATDLAANSRTSYHAQDRTFAVGIGANFTNRADGFEVFKNGRIYADELDLNEITDNKQLVTKEYVDNLSKVKRVNNLPTAPSLGKILIHGNDGNRLKIFLNGTWHTIVTP